MLFTSIVALAMGNLAAAQFSNSTTTPTTEIGGVPTSGPSNDVDGYAYYGCIFSDDGFPGFVLASTSEDNSPKACGATCKGRFFGLYDANCYCGDFLDTAKSGKLPDDQCDIECPGVPTDSCGGIRTNARLARRQSIDASILLSIYISIGEEESTATVTETADAGLTTETVTATVTEADGDVVTNTLTNTLIVVPTGIAIICYGDWCAPEHYCPVCTKYQVVCRDGSCCPEECTGDDWDKLVICEGDDCHYSMGNCDQKVTCNGDDCKWEHGITEGKKFVCNGDDCSHESCTGDDCWTKELCTGDDCTKDIPCTGTGCPTPQPNVPTPGKVVYVPNETPAVVVSGSAKKVVGGLAALIAGAVFLL
ncbi:hypothetical protein G7Z17_g6713 [Cylindrodendrum hubeiense]|uniref:WSC domain-containing protein n=1 Tax=Cylindrodendrum hubeiense TaxID=595255 RepID=A0A9P5HBT6_9HYPO|nr:hypothetical protein G7Z17_g6713 [Cylindrodendrum hubeiense]